MRKVDGPRTEQLFQRLQAHLRQHVEQAGAQEQPVGDQGVQMRVPIELFAKGVDRHDDAGQAVGQNQRPSCLAVASGEGGCRRTPAGTRAYSGRSVHERTPVPNRRNPGTC